MSKHLNDVITELTLNRLADFTNLQRESHRIEFGNHRAARANQPRSPPLSLVPVSVETSAATLAKSSPLSNRWRTVFAVASSATRIWRAQISSCERGVLAVIGIHQFLTKDVRFIHGAQLIPCDSQFCIIGNACLRKSVESLEEYMVWMLGKEYRLGRAFQLQLARRRSSVMPVSS